MNIACTPMERCFEAFEEPLLLLQTQFIFILRSCLNEALKLSECNFAIMVRIAM